MITRQILPLTIFGLAIAISIYSCNDKGCTDSKALNYSADNFEDDNSCRYTTFGIYLSKGTFENEENSDSCNRIDTAFVYIYNIIRDTIIGVYYPTTPSVCNAPGIIPINTTEPITPYNVTLKGCFNGNDTIVYLTGTLEADPNQSCKTIPVN